MPTTDENSWKPQQTSLHAVIVQKTVLQQYLTKSIYGCLNFWQIYQYFPKDAN